MNPSASQAPAKYLADIQNVREVMLSGAADLAFWRDHLRRTGLTPLDRQGRAELLISATHIRWMGTRFNEFSISVAVCGKDPASTPDGFYLVHAWNSFRFHALMERTFFHTPYSHRPIGLVSQVPALIRLGGGFVVFEAAMCSSTPAIRSGDETWEGPIYLPSPAPGSRAPVKYFMALLAGYTETYAFLPSDALDIRPGQRDGAFHALVDSGFAPQEWRIRNNAHHAKSRTFQRA